MDETQRDTTAKCLELCRHLVREMNLVKDRLYIRSAQLKICREVLEKILRERHSISCNPDENSKELRLDPEQCLLCYARLAFEAMDALELKSTD